MTQESDQIATLFETMARATSDRSEAIEDLYISLTNAKLLRRVTLHEYRCKRGKPLAIVFGSRGLTLCATSDYKFTRGLNESVSVEAARKSRTLDGERWWPSHVYDVSEMSEFGGMQIACEHYRGTLVASEVLQTVNGVTPGHPTKPTIL